MRIETRFDVGDRVTTDATDWTPEYRQPYAHVATRSGTVNGIETSSNAQGTSVRYLVAFKAGAGGYAHGQWIDEGHVQAGRKGSCTIAIGNWLTSHEIAAVIPYRDNESGPQEYDREVYRERPIIERTISRLKRYRRITTRYVKLAAT